MSKQTKFTILVGALCGFFGFAVATIISLAFMPDQRPMMIIYVIVALLWFFVTMSFLYFKKPY